MATLIRVHVQPEKLHIAGQVWAVAISGIVTKVEGRGPRLLTENNDFVLRWIRTKRCNTA